MLASFATFGKNSGGELIFCSISVPEQLHRQGMTLFHKQTKALPGLSWAKGGALDARAWLTSLAVHLSVLIVAAVLSFVLPRAAEELAISYELPELFEEEEPLPQEFLSADEPMEDYGALSQSGADSARALATVVEDHSLVIFKPEEITDFGELTAIEVDAPIFQGPESFEKLPVQGVGNVGVSGAVGAIDRLTHEILKSVEQQPTLVVWLFDQSGSLRDERARILKRFHGIYDQLGVIEAAKIPAFEQHQDKPLLTAVVQFGASPQILTKQPTDQIEEIEAAVRAIEDDASGQENVFQAVATMATKFRSYRTPAEGSRNVMLIVFTDEAGDDASEMEATVYLCRRLAMPVYVVGRPAPFGRRAAYVKWIDPDPQFDQRPQWVPVNMGPESLLPERLKLQFFGSRRNEELIDSGFGPYGLTRLCYETGGLYFAAHPNREVGRRIGGRETENLAAYFSAFFDPEVMRRYQPDYISSKEYWQAARASGPRKALLEAAQLSWTTQLEDIRTRFPKQDEAQLAQSLSVAQRAAALRQPQIDRICQILLTGEDDRAELKGLRWQAGFDLAIGRALATKVRTDGYNAMLAKAKQGMAFQNAENNTWVLVADDVYANSSLEKTARKAREYLIQVSIHHAGTPWAYLADRELRTPLGWRWDEDYTYIPSPADIANNNNRPRPEPRQRPARPPRRDPPRL